jgi:4-carboxymuconolactone decarboxylase
MRYKILAASLLALSTAGVTAVAQPPAASSQAPTSDDVRRAIADLPSGRVQRPDSYESLTPAQMGYLEGVLSGPRNAISGPLVVMLASPELGDLAQRTMAYARFAGLNGAGSVPPRLNELAVIMAAKAWSSPYVWDAHHAYAVRMGLPAELVEAVRTGAPAPDTLEPDVKAIYAFLDEFMKTKQVSDANFAAARAVLGGDKPLVDLIGTLAIYQMSAMLTAVDRTGLSEDEEPTLRPLD